MPSPDHSAVRPLVIAGHALAMAGGLTGFAIFLYFMHGYAPALYDTDFRSEEMLGFGRAPFRIADPGYAIKMFPSQFGTHFGITAALELYPKIPSAAAIRHVTLTAPVMAYVNRPRPKTGLDGKFSLQYTAASALLDGKVGIRTFACPLVLQFVRVLQVFANDLRHVRHTAGTVLQA